MSPPNTPADREKLIGELTRDCRWFAPRGCVALRVPAADRCTACQAADALSQQHADSQRLDEIRWFGCMTGDCPHETQAQCDVAILGVVRSVIIERDAAPFIREAKAISASHPEKNNG